MGQEECQHQFRNSRWNCSTSTPASDPQDIYGNVMRISMFLYVFVYICIKKWNKIQIQYYSND